MISDMSEEGGPVSRFCEIAGWSDLETPSAKRMGNT